MTYELKPHAEDYEIPYKYELSDGKNSIYYYGTQHTREPDNPTFKDIEKAIATYTPDLVMVEGVDSLHPDRVTPEVIADLRFRFEGMTEAEIKGQMGEMAYTAKLAIYAGIPVLSPEPDLSQQVEFLLRQGFTQSEIFVYYILRVVPQWYRTQSRPEFEHYIQHTLIELSHLHWANFDYSFQSFIKLYRQITSEDFNESDQEHYYDLTNPWDQAGMNSVFNKISRENSDFRDQEILRVIGTMRQTYKRIFIIYGAGHAFLQRSALEQMYTN